MAGKMNSDLFAASKAERLNRNYAESELVSPRTFNLVMGIVVAYGLGVNALFCKLFPNIIYSFNPWVLLIGYIVCVIAGFMIAHRSANPVISFLGYNLIVLPIGVVLSGLVEAYGGVDSTVVLQAFVYTFGITVIMTAAGACFPDFFRGMGRTLFLALAGLLIVRLIGMLFGMRGGYFFDVIGAGLFSLYIGFDFCRSQRYAPTLDNAVDCAIDIYLDIVNLFIHILSILGKDNK